MLTNDQHNRRAPKYRYLIKTDLAEFIKTDKPRCYSCHDSNPEYLISNWACINEHTNEELFVCQDCLDLCTDSKCPIDILDADWTKRSNLNKLRAYHCESDGDFFVTALPGQSFRLESLNPNNED